MSTFRYLLPFLHIRQQRRCLTFLKHSKNVVAICRLALAQFKLVDMSEGADVPILQDPPLS